MSSESDGEVDRLKVDRVFAEAVKLGIVLRKEASLVDCWAFDLSGMSFPVARAACRYILTLIKKRESLKDLTFITGGGVHRQTGIQEILMRDFNPGLVSIVPKRARGTVEIEAETLAAWIKQ